MKRKSFTLIELLVVIAIIGLLSSIVLVSLSGVREKARDTRRISDMNQIILALEMYYNDYEAYPEESSGNGSWENSTEDGGAFIESLVFGEYLGSYIVDPINSGSTYYSYYVYPAGSSGCSSSNGEFFVLGVRDMESSGRPHPDSPGWSCPSRDWQNEFDWVAGGFEK